MTKSRNFDLLFLGVLALFLLFLPHSSSLLVAARTVNDLEQSSIIYQSPVSDDLLGSSLSFIGDFNGDGFDDYVIDSSSNGYGASYLIYGNSSPPLFSILPDSILFSQNGVIFDGFIVYSTPRVSPAGDFNGDGFDDFVFRFPSSSSDGYSANGEIFLIHGTPNPFQDRQQINLLNSSVATRFFGSTNNSQLGTSFSSVGDVNNDGFDDIFIMAYSPVDTPNNPVLVYGTNETFAGDFNISSINGTNGVSFESTYFKRIGFAVTGIGDVNQDGYPDFIIGTQDAKFGADTKGVVHIVYGSATPYAHPFDLDTLNGSNGIQINGSLLNGAFGSRTTAVKDFNGDGIPDFLLSAPFYFDSSNPLLASYGVGTVYLFYGNGSYFHNMDISSFTSAHGVQFFGNSEGELGAYLGMGVMSSGDFNGDGFSDILMASESQKPRGKPAWSGTIALIYGRPSLSSPYYLISLYNESNYDFQFNGQTYNQYFGTNSFQSGDFNNDGIDDILIGSYYQPAGSLKGQAYLLPGFSATQTDRLGHRFDLETQNPIPCQGGTYSEFSGLVQCTLCPEDTYSVSIKAVSIDTCKKCSELAICEPGTATPLPIPGYQTIPGTINSFGPCDPPEACPGGSRTICSAGYTNPNSLCFDCEVGYYRSMNRCEQCPSSAGLPFVIIFYFLVVPLPLLLPRNSFLGAQLKSESPVGNHSRLFIASSIISFSQLYSLFQHLPFKSYWNFLLDFFSLSLISFQGLAKPQCSSSTLVSGSILSLTAISLFLPFIVFFYLGLIFVIFHFVLKREYMTVQHFYQAFIFLLFTVLYLPVTIASFQIFDCKPLTDSFSSLRVDPGFQCFTGDWWWYGIFAVLFIIFITCGLPISYLYAGKYPERFPKFTDSLIPLTLKYSSTRKYWEAVTLCSHAFIAFLFIGLPNNTGVSLSIILISYVVLMIYSSSNSKSPFLHPFWNTLEVLKFAFLFILSCLFAFLIGLNNDTTASAYDDSATGNIISALSLISIIFYFLSIIKIVRFGNSEPDLSNTLGNDDSNSDIELDS